MRLNREPCFAYPRWERSSRSRLMHTGPYRTARFLPEIPKLLAILVVFMNGACGRIGYDQVTFDASIDGGLVDAHDATDSFMPFDGSLRGAVSAVFAGYSTTCAILLTGELFCFGDGGSGQFGIQPGSDVLAPRDLRIEGVREVAIGELSICVRRDTTPYVQCAGDGTSGQLGDGTIAARASFAPSSIGAVTSLMAGWRHVVARTSATQLHVWGNGTYGQLGQGSTNSSASPISLATSLDQITAGGFHTCGRRATTGIECWGRSDEGQSGIAAGNVLSPTLVSATASQRYLDIDAGQFHTCAVRDDGSVECWGQNTFGQLGDMSAGGSTPTLVMGLPEIRDIDCGYYHCCGHTRSGDELWCWGAGDSGQLGRGGVVSRATAGRVVGLGAVSSFVTGAFHTCAVDTRAELWCWGANESGQLGTGDTMSSGTPIQVDFE